MTPTLAEPAKEVFAQEFRDGPQGLRVGLEVVGPKLRLFARTRTRKGRKWVDHGGVEFAPELPPLVQASLSAAFRLFTDKKGEVEEVLKLLREKKQRRKRR